MSHTLPDQTKDLPQSTHGTDKHRKYGQFQNGLYREGILHNRLPLVTTDPNKLEEQARLVLPPGPYNYVAGGAGERATMDANRLAFRQWKMVPRMLQPTTTRDLSVKLFGETYGKWYWNTSVLTFSAHKKANNGTQIHQSSWHP